MPKPGPTDTKPALLTPGEYVMNREAVALVGADNLEKANKMGLKMRQNKLPGYQDGGLVKNTGLYGYKDPFEGFQNPNNTAKQFLGDTGIQSQIGSVVKPITQPGLQSTASADGSNPYSSAPAFADSDAALKGVDTPLKNNLLSGYANGGLVEGDKFTMRPNYPGTIAPEKSVGALAETGLVPTGEGSVPPVTEPVRVKEGFFNVPAQEPGFTTRPNYEGSIPPEKSLSLTSRAPMVSAEPGTSLVPAGIRKAAGPEVKVRDGFFNVPAQEPGFTSRPNYEGSIPPEKSLSPVANPKAAGVVSGAKGLLRGLASGALATEAANAAGNVAYNAQDKSPFSNVINAATTYALGDTEGAKRKLFGLPVENAPPLTRAAVTGVRKLGDVVGFQQSPIGKTLSSKSEPEQEQEQEAAAAKPTAPPRPTAQQAVTKPVALSAEKMLPGSDTRADLGGGSYIESANTKGINRVKGLVAGGGLSNPEKEARFARDAQNTADMAAKYGNGKEDPALTEIRSLQNIALYGGPTGNMTPTQFWAAKRRQDNAKAILGEKIRDLQVTKQNELQNKTLSQNAQIASEQKAYSRQKDAADRELRKQEINKQPLSFQKVKVSNPDNPLDVHEEVQAFDTRTGAKVDPAARKLQQQTRLQALTAAVNDPNKPPEWKQRVIQMYNAEHPESPFAADNTQ